jgi:hypothetical protein
MMTSAIDLPHLPHSDRYGVRSAPDDRCAHSPELRIRTDSRLWWPESLKRAAWQVDHVIF